MKPVLFCLLLLLCGQILSAGVLKSMVTIQKDTTGGLVLSCNLLDIPKKARIDLAILTCEVDTTQIQSNSMWTVESEGKRIGRYWVPNKTRKGAGRSMVQMLVTDQIRESVEKNATSFILHLEEQISQKERVGTLSSNVLLTVYFTLTE